MAEDLRKASAAVRVRGQLEATISELTAKLKEEQAARELSHKNMLEASLAVEAKRKEEMIVLHQKVSL